MRPAARRLAWLLLLAGIAGALAWGFRPQPAEVDLVVVARGPLEVTVDEDGRTRVRERYVVSAPVTGRLLRVALRAGDEVEAGSTVIATIEPAPAALLDDRERTQATARVEAAEDAVRGAEAAFGHAKAEREQAERDLERTQRLVTSRTATRQELDQAETRVRLAAEDLRAAEFRAQVAQHEAELARALLLRTQPPSNGSPPETRLEIRAPATGRVLRVFQESAAVVTAGTRILEVGDARDLEVEVDVLSADAVRIRPGARARLERWGGERPLAASVRRVEPAGFTKVSALGVEEQRVTVLLSLDEPPEARAALGDQFRVEARIVVWEAPDVLQVAAGALFRREGRWAAFRVEGDVARLVDVEVGEQNGLVAEVRGGLAAGDRVVVHPSDRVADGVSVRAR